jgi:hypothetical protein
LALSGRQPSSPFLGKKGPKKRSLIGTRFAAGARQMDKSFFGLLRLVENPKNKASSRKQAVLFLKKKNQKNFCPFPDVIAETRHRRPTGPNG